MGRSKSKPRPPEEVLGSLAGGAGENPFKRQRPLPLDRSVFWYPVDQGGLFRASAYNAAGESALSAQTIYLTGGRGSIGL